MCRFRNGMEAYQSIAFGKRQPLLEELLDEIEVRLEGQSGKLGELQQFDVQRRRISNDLHVHLNQSRSRISHSPQNQITESTQLKTNPEFDFLFPSFFLGQERVEFQCIGNRSRVTRFYNEMEQMRLRYSDWEQRIQPGTLDLSGIIINQLAIYIIIQ